MSDGLRDSNPMDVDISPEAIAESQRLAARPPLEPREPPLLLRWWWKLEWWCSQDGRRYLLSPRRDDDDPWWRVIRCRLRGHPCGVVWYNPGGLEPDMTCKECGDDLG